MKTLRLEALLLALLPSAALAWTALVPDTPDDSTAFAVTTDENGFVLAAGRAINAEGGDDGLVAKLGSAGGAVLWRQTISGTTPVGGGGEDDPTEIMRAIAAAAGGDALVAGRVVNDGTGADALVARRAAADGAIVWEVALDGGGAGADDAQAASIDAAGDVVVAGALTPLGGVSQAAVLKLAGADGEESWRALVPGDGGL